MKVDMNYVKDLLVEILDIPSPGGDTEVAMERLNKEFKALGCEVYGTNKGAIYTTLKGEDDENQKTITAHIDTLGAMVTEIKANGRLKLSGIGGFAWNSVEGENVIIKTMKGKSYTGTIMPIKASMHVHAEESFKMTRTEETVEVRIDEDVHSKDEVLNLGIKVGDFVYFEPRTVITDSGYIKARHLDDKAAVAIVFGVCKYLKENNIKPKYTTNFFISDYEEIGHGVYAIPEKTKEFVALDIGPVGEGHTSEEHSVCICAKDSRTPYNFKLRKKLVELAERNNIKHVVDVYYRYGSDASMIVLQGKDFNFACLGPGVDATHHYERTHLDSIENTIQLIIKYITE